MSGLPSGAMPSITDTVTQKTIDDYAELSGDFNPLHVDPVIAEASSFKGTIAHGPVALQAFFRSMTAWLGVEALPSATSVQVTYRAPVRPGDAITCELRERTDSETEALLQAECVNQDGVTVVSITASLPR